MKICYSESINLSENKTKHALTVKSEPFVTHFLFSMHQNSMFLDKKGQFWCMIKLFYLPPMSLFLFIPKCGFWAPTYLPLCMMSPFLLFFLIASLNTEQSWSEYSDYSNYSNSSVRIVLFVFVFIWFLNVEYYSNIWIVAYEYWIVELRKISA